MSDQRLSPRWKAFGLLAAVLAFLMTALAPNVAAADDPNDPTIGGVSVDQVVKALGDDHVAVIGSGADEAALAKIAAAARAKGLDLSIVSLSARLTSDYADTLAQQVLTRVHGTVLVLTPVSGAPDSDELSEKQQQDAAAAAKAAGGSDVSAAQAFADSATAKPFPWSLVVIGAIILVVIGAIVLGMRERTRKRKADHATLADLTQGLAKRVGVLGSLILGISARIGMVERPDLQARFGRGSAEYNRLRDQVATPLQSRTEVDAAAADIAALDKQLGDIDEQLDALLPGLEPPAPAG